MRPRAGVLLSALALGAAPFIMFSTESVLVLSYNSSLLRYESDAAVGMMTILATLMQFLMLPAQGLAQGAQPIISNNYGVGDAARVREAFRRLIASAFAVTLAVYLLFMLAPEIVIRPFTSDPALIVRTSWRMKIYFFCRDSDRRSDGVAANSYGPRHVRPFDVPFSAAQSFSSDSVHIYLPAFRGRQNFRRDSCGTRSGRDFSYNDYNSFHAAI